MTPTPLVAQKSSKLLHIPLPALMAHNPAVCVTPRGPPVALAPPGASAPGRHESRGSWASADTIAGSAISSEVARSWGEKARWHRRKLHKRAVWREIQPSLSEDDFLWRPISLSSVCEMSIWARVACVSNNDCVSCVSMGRQIQTRSSRQNQVSCQWSEKWAHILQIVHS